MTNKFIDQVRLLVKTILIPQSILHFLLKKKLFKIIYLIIIKSVFDDSNGSYTWLF